MAGATEGMADVPDDDREREDRGESQPTQDFAPSGLSQAASYHPVEGLWEGIVI